MRCVILPTLLVLFSVAGASAQSVEGLPVGQYVRVTAEKLWWYGTFEGVANDSLVLRSGEPGKPNNRRLALPLSSIARLEARTGRKGHATTGLVVGGIIGVVGGAAGAAGLSCVDLGYGSSSTCGDTAPVIVGGLLGGILFGGLGAAIGSGIKTDRWEDVPLDQLRLGLRMAFGQEPALVLHIRF